MLLLPLLTASITNAYVPVRKPKIIFPVIQRTADNEILTSSKISYNIGNPVLTGAVNVYNIYYGNWTAKQKGIVETYLHGVGSSSWWNIENKYYFQQNYTAQKIYVSDDIIFAGAADDNYSKGKSLSGNDLPDIIQAKFDSSELPEDTNAVYFVLTSGDVDESMRDDIGPASFCQDYCGYHVSWQMKSGNRIYYAMGGIPTKCLKGCAIYNTVISPNGEPGVEAMMSVVAHELAEAVSDPFSDGDRAWEDANGSENADKCAWTFGNTYKTSNGAMANQKVNGKEYLIQRNWDPVTQSCAAS